MGSEVGSAGEAHEFASSGLAYAGHLDGDEFSGQTRVADEHGFATHGGHEHAGMVVGRLVEQDDPAFEFAGESTPAI